LALLVKSLVHFVLEEDGQGLAEYALILVIVSIATVSALTFVGDVTIGLLSSANATLLSSTT
jgi:Flp pilus assembly pilin Flp